MIEADPKADPKSDLQRYLQEAREALLWKLDGLSEHDVRRPLTPTGTNLLGLVKHLAGVELLYLGYVFGRHYDEPVPRAVAGPRGPDRGRTNSPESRDDDGPERHAVRAIVQAVARG